MASDISLAVGGGARRMTYAELALVRGTSQPSAERLVRRRGWPRQVGNDGVVRVFVPLTEARNISNSAGGAASPGQAPDNGEVAPAPVEVSPGLMAPADRGLVRGLENAIEALQEQLQVANTQLNAERQRVDDLLYQLAEAPREDPLTAIGIQTLSQAVEMLREDVERERDRADRAERQAEDERELVEEGRKRVDELQVSLADERRRIDGLHTDLADARTAAMISGCEAAVLRTRLELLSERRPWWRKWFR